MTELVTDEGKYKGLNRPLVNSTLSPSLQTLNHESQWIAESLLRELPRVPRLKVQEYQAMWYEQTLNHLF